MGTGDCAHPSGHFLVTWLTGPCPLPALTHCHFFYALQPLRPRIQLTAPFGSSMVMLSVLTQFLPCSNPDSASQADWDLLDGSGP